MDLIYLKFVVKDLPKTHMIYYFWIPNCLIDKVRGFQPMCLGTKACRWMYCRSKIFSSVKNDLFHHFNAAVSNVSMRVATNVATEVSLSPHLWKKKVMAKIFIIFWLQFKQKLIKKYWPKNCYCFIAFNSHFLQL